MTKIEENSASVQSHLQIMQNVIQRMSGNSSSCKAWCITIVSAIFVVIADKGKPMFGLIAIVPILLFLFLDTYYLTMEYEFRKSYEGFIKKLHNDNLNIEDLYVVKPTGKIIPDFFMEIFSISIFPFYFVLIAMMILYTLYIK